MNKWPLKCRIRRCCQKKGYHTCAECEMDVKQCKTHNNLIGKILSVLLDSNRAASIRYIRENGEEDFAEKMAWDERMTMRRR